MAFLQLKKEGDEHLQAELVINRARQLELVLKCFAQWQDRLDNLAPFPTAVVPDPFGKESVAMLAPQEHPLYWPGQLNPLAIYALWPSEELGLGSADTALLATAERTVRTMGAMGSYSNGESAHGRGARKGAHSRARTDPDAFAPPSPSPPRRKRFSRDIPCGGARRHERELDPR